jgi:hypothetical protein
MVNDLLFEMKGGKKGVADKDKTKQRIKKRSTTKDEIKRKMFATKKGVADKDKTKQRIKKRSTTKDEIKRKMFAKKTSKKTKAQQKGRINEKSDLYKQGNNNLNQTVIIVIRKRISV